MSDRICQDCSCQINKKGRRAGYVKKGGGTGVCYWCEQTRKDKAKRQAEAKANPDKPKRRSLAPLFATMALLGTLGPWGRDT